jgi:hypothetical protein
MPRHQIAEHFAGGFEDDLICEARHSPKPVRADIYKVVTG